MTTAYIVDAVRTAGGRRGGRLAGVHPVDLAAHSLDAIVKRSGIDPSAVEDVIMGCVSQGGEQAIGRGGETWVVDWGTLLGISTTDATPGIGAHFESLEWGGVRPDFGLIDSGDWAQKVYDECYKYYGKLWPTKGSGANFGSWNVSEVKSHPGLELYLYVDRTAKMELYAGRIQKGAAPALHLPEDADQDLLAGLSGQQLEKPRGGGLAQWRKLPNDH